MSKKIAKRKTIKAKGRLTLLQKRFFNYYLDEKSPTFGNGSQSALRAGYSYRTSAIDVLSSPVANKYFKVLLDKMGLDDKRLNHKLNKLLDAKKLGLCSSQEPTNSENESVNSSNSVEYKLVEDNTVQLNALKLAHQLKGRLSNGSEKMNSMVVNQTNMVIVVKEGEEQIGDSEDSGNSGNSGNYGTSNLLSNKKTESSVQIIDIPE